MGLQSCKIQFELPSTWLDYFALSTVKSTPCKVKMIALHRHFLVKTFGTATYDLTQIASSMD